MNGAPIASDLLIQRTLELLGQRFTSLWPVDETPCYQGLLEAIDKIDRGFHRRTRPRATVWPTL